MKTQLFWKSALVSTALMCALGCARDPAVGAGASVGGGSQGEASSSAVAQTTVEFDYSSVSPSSPYAVLDVTKANSSFDEKFSLLAGFNGSEAAEELNFFWYINWVPASDSASPVTSGQGLHTLSDLEVAHLACDNKAGEADFDLYVVATSSEWSDDDARAWTSQSNFLFWDWSVTWDTGACADLPELPADDGGAGPHPEGRVREGLRPGARPEPQP